MPGSHEQPNNAQTEPSGVGIGDILGDQKGDIAGRDIIQTTNNYYYRDMSPQTQSDDQPALPPRLFLSHHHEIDTKLLEQLRTVIEEAGFEILQSHSHWTTDVAGQQQRLVELGSCHGGILLLDNASCKQDEIQLEASLMRWFNWLEPRFELLVIGLQLDSTHLQAEQWTLLELSSVDWMDRHDTVVSTVEKFVSGISTKQSLDNPMVRLARRLHHVFPEIPPQELQFAWNDLTKNCPASHDESIPLAKHHVTQQLLRRGIKGEHFFDFMRTMGPFVSQPHALETLLYLLEPTIFDIRSAGLLAKVKTSACQTIGFLLDSKKPPFTVDMYIRRASCETDANYRWETIFITGEGGENSFDTITNEIYNYFKRIFDDEDWNELSSSEKNEIINKSDDRPKFIVLPEWTVTDMALLTRLTQTYSTFIFIITTTKETDSKTPFGFEYLYPRLTVIDEIKASMTVNKIKKLVLANNEQRV